MKRSCIRTFVLFVLPSCAVFAVLWTIQQGRGSSDTRTEAQLLRETRLGLESQLRELEDQVVASEKEQAEMQAMLTRTRESNAATEQHTARVAAPEKLDLWSIVMSDPVLQNLYLASERARMAERYAAIFRNLGLSASQIDRLEELILRRNEQRMDLDDVLRSNHLSERDAAVIKLQEKATKSFRADVVGLLGEHAFQIFTNYERALPVRELVNKLAGAVAFEGQPLTEPQATQLTETLVVSSPPYRDGGTADTNTIDWPAVIAESPKILTPPQQASFLNMAPVYRVDNDTLETPDP